jgi:hypothetical protein
MPNHTYGGYGMIFSDKTPMNAYYLNSVADSHVGKVFAGQLPEPNSAARLICSSKEAKTYS